MRLFHWSAAILLGGVLSAAPVPDDARVRDLLGVPDRIVFLAGFGEVLAALDASNIGAFHQTLTAGIEKEEVPVRHAPDAVKGVEQRWAKLDPKGFLEACAARKRQFSAEAQNEAMNALLKTDRELALRLFLRVPLYEKFAARCQFYERLAAVDPERAVRFFFETSERDRIFANPLEISFRAWARRDFNAAWAAALRINEETWSRPARNTVLNHAASQGIDQACALLASIPDPSARDEAAGDLIHLGQSIKAPQAIEIAKRIDSLRVWRDLACSEHLGKPVDAVRKLLEVLPPARRVPVIAALIREKSFSKSGPAQVEELYALIPDEHQREAVRRVVAGRMEDDDTPLEMAPAELQFEELLAGGHHAYKAILDGDKAAALAKAMFQKFPERSLPWWMQLDRDTRSYLMPDLAAAWPAAKLAADTPRFLASASALENEFGTALGRRWLKEHPEIALVVIFSDHARYAETFQQSIAFYRLKGELQWEPAKIEKLLDQIRDPKGQAIARREWLLECFRGMPVSEALHRIVTLRDEGDFRRAANMVVSRWLHVRNAPEAFNQILAIPAEYGDARDRILAIAADQITDYREVDASRLPDILTAIQNPAVRLKVMAEIRDTSAVRPHAERLVGLLATMKPCAARDQLLGSYLGEIPAADALGFARRTDQMLIRRLILGRLVASEFTAAEIAECEELLASLPAAHRDGRVADRWFVRQAKLDPAAKWPEVMTRLAADASFLPLACEVLSVWRKKDLPAALNAVIATGPAPGFVEWLPDMIRSSARENPPKAFEDLLARPLRVHRELGGVVDVWLESDPRAACAACLRIEDSSIRQDSLRRGLAVWARKDPAAATIWVRGLPPGMERDQAFSGLAAALPAGQNPLADDLTSGESLDRPIPGGSRF